MIGYRDNGVRTAITATVWAFINISLCALLPLPVRICNQICGHKRVMVWLLLPILPHAVHRLTLIFYVFCCLYCHYKIFMFFRLRLISFIVRFGQCSFSALYKTKKFVMPNSRWSNFKQRCIRPSSFEKPK